MATVQQIRDGLKARLDTISGLNAHAQMPVPSINSPAAVVFRRSTDFDSSTDSDDLTFGITVFIDLARQSAQDELDAYTAGEGANSIRAAIDADPTLGGVVDWCRVAQVESDRVTEWSNVRCLSADIVVQVG